MLVFMWQRLKNLLLSFQTYGALSPDLRVRRQVNRALRDRPSLNVEQWYVAHCQPQDIPYDVASFAYTHLEKYSGLNFARVVPSDRLDEDLQWTRVCWFDWAVSLCDDVLDEFGVDISDSFDEMSLDTVGDLLLALNDSLNPDVGAIPHTDLSFHNDVPSSQKL
ncbi:MAG TPA: hypothetical protein IGS37_03125 [Synechococcales cyanobacterium M55_K2018_004]|nr:hypothetical protein [Synechococcales cyanobacterium M55_K2018_004]